MSLAGKLEDVPLADVMQFIHLGQRTGTLSVKRGDDRAEINFHDGAIVGARSPSSRRLGELLIEENVLGPEELRAALEKQEEAEEDLSLGRVLLEEDMVSKDSIRDAVRAQIERTIYELVTWAHGSFNFELDDLEPMDDIAVSPGDLVPDIDLNTQMVLLEAARIFDERNRDRARERPETGTDPLPSPTESVSPPSGSPGQAQEEKEKENEPAEKAEALFDRQAPETRRAPVAAEPSSASSRGRETRSRETPTAIAAPPISEYGTGEDHRRSPRGAHPLGDLIEPEESILVLHLVDPGSQEFGTELSLRLQDLDAEIREVPPPEAGGALEGQTPAAVAYHVTDESPLEGLAALTRRHPELPVICILDDVSRAGRAYGVGAAAVVPREADAVVRCFESLSRFRTKSRSELASENRSAYAKLRRVVSDLRSGLFSASVALNLMNVIAESVERAVLFLVRRETLSALGAFGFDEQHRPLAEVTKGIAIEREHDNALTRAVATGQALTTTFEAAHLPQPLADVLGEPAYDEVAIFPVLGSDRVILVIYTDNGRLDRPIQEIDFLDLAAAEVGIAFENELLRRQLGKDQSS